MGGGQTTTRTLKPADHGHHKDDSPACTPPIGTHSAPHRSSGGSAGSAWCARCGPAWAPSPAATSATAATATPSDPGPPAHRPVRLARALQRLGHVGPQGGDRRRRLIARPHLDGNHGAGHGCVERPAVAVPVADQRVVERIGQPRSRARGLGRGQRSSLSVGPRSLNAVIGQVPVHVGIGVRHDGRQHGLGVRLHARFRRAVARCRPRSEARHSTASAVSLYSTTWSSPNATRRSLTSAGAA